MSPGQSGMPGTGLSRRAGPGPGRPQPRNRPPALPSKTRNPRPDRRGQSPAPPPRKFCNTPYSAPIWRRSHPRWQGVPPVPNSNSVAISVTDAEFFDGMRFAGTGWPGTHGPWLVSLALSGCALEDGLSRLSRAELGEVAKDSVGVHGGRCELAGSRAAARTLPSPGCARDWRHGALVGCLQGLRSLCAGTFRALGRDGPGGNGKCLALVPRRKRGCAMITQDTPEPRLRWPRRHVPPSQMRTG